MINIDISSVSGTANMYQNNIIQNDKNKSDSFQSKLENASAKNDDEELKKACTEFESYFIQTMYKAMRKTVNSSEGFMKKSQGEEIFQDMLDEESSKASAKQGGIGLADMMYKQMKREKDNAVTV